VPPGVVGCLDRLEALDGELFASESLDVDRMAPVRRREYVAGRVAARRVLQQLTGQTLAVPRGSDHAPVWPPDLCGSLSHSRRYAVCVAARRDQHRALGVDVEDAGRVGPDLWPTLFTPAELRRISATPAAERNRLAALLFSAKEACYKLLSSAAALAKPGFEPLDYEIRPGDDLDRVSATHRPGAHPPLEGRSVFFDQHWLTLFFLPATQITAESGPTPSAGHR
jgi:4'-phosphopantetheinyl transferase EntD